MERAEFNFIKDAFSQIIDDVAGNPDWHDAASAVSADLGALERELEGKVVSPDKSLEEAATTYAWEHQEAHTNEVGEIEFDYGPRYSAFIAGAEYQARQLLQDSPMPEDAVLFNKGEEEDQVAGRDFVPVDWVDTLDKYGKWKIVKVEPKVDLEEAYKEFCKDYPFPWSSQYVNREYIDELCLSVARHFYELGQSQMPMPEDTVLFNKGVAEGRRLEREDRQEKDEYMERTSPFILSESFNWDAFRREAAKDLLCAIIQGNESYDSLYVVHHSVEMADKLIKQLRNNEKD